MAVRPHPGDAAGPCATGPPGDAPRDVLVLRALGLGDALTAVPALRGLRRRWPHARLWLAGPADVGEWLRRCGVVDAVLPAVGLRTPPALSWPGDAGHVAVDLHGCGPASHRALLATGPGRLVAFACPEVGNDGPAWAEGEHEVHRWCRLVGAVGGVCGPDDLRVRPDLTVGDGRGPDEREVVLHPGAAAEARRWPVMRWARLASALAAHGLPVTVTGSAAEVARCEAVVAHAVAPRPALRALNAAGALDLDGLSRLVASARVVVSGDTGVAHLATAVGTPSVLLMGPTSPDRWGPLLDPTRHRVLWHGDPAAPGDPHARWTDPALLRITVEEALEATLDQVARGPVALTPAA